MVTARKEIETTLTDVASSQDFTSTFIKGSWIAYFISALFQIIFFTDLTNLAVVVIIGIGWLLYTKAFVRYELFRAFSLSSLVVFGFASTHILFPLIFTSLEGKPVTYNLEYPEVVFLHSLAAMAVLMVSHTVYRSFSKLADRRRSFSLVETIGLFTAPTDLQLWIMGLIGLGSMYYIYFIAPDVWQSVTGSAADKLVQSLMSFAYAPFLIVCGVLYGRKSKSLGANAAFLILFMIALFGLGIGRSSTGAIMFGFTSIAFAYLIGCFVGIFRPRFFTFRNFIVAGIAIWLVVGPLADLRTAMVIVRGERKEISAEQLFLQTMEAYSDKEAIRQRRADDSGEGIMDPDWDERYLDNVLTARFANVKFNDLSLGRAEQLGTYDPEMLGFAHDYLIGALPDPIIKFFNFDVDKEFVYSISTGDFIYLNSGGQGTPEGFRVGHFAGTGMATFGWWYLAILGVGIIPVFYLIDLFQQKKKDHNHQGEKDSAHINFSACGLLALTSFFQFLQLETVTQLGTYIIRGWLQLTFLYLVIFYLTRLISGAGMKRLKWTAAST
ncbi:MAG TPA: hypothetical protein VK658_20655 [Chryseolinea sp.]|nr:hypothetical protein [Chryseolinea sp.]